MATTEPMVTRTLRAAVKIGDDYYTVEETITLPPGATEAQIDAAIDTGRRIYEAQRVAVSTQLGTLREDARSSAGTASAAADTPASDKQRHFLERIGGDLGWSTARVADFARSVVEADLQTLTKDQASRVIDGLLAIRDGTAQAPPYTPPPTPLEQAVEATPEPAAPRDPAEARATPRQIGVLQKLLAERDVKPYQGRPFAELSGTEAGSLISEWQQRPRRPAADDGGDLPF